MGKGARNRDRRRQRQQGRGGLEGRNPLTLGADRLEQLVPVAFDHIMTAGTADSAVNRISSRLLVLVVLAAVALGVFGNPAACVGTAMVVRALLKHDRPP